MTTAFVLSGGAALGAVQVGMSQALMTAGSVRILSLAPASGRPTQPGSQVTQLVHTSTIWKPSGYRYGGAGLPVRSDRPVRPGDDRRTPLHGWRGRQRGHRPCRRRRGQQRVFAADRMIVLFGPSPVGALGMALHGLAVLVQHRLAVDVDHFGRIVDVRVVSPPCPIKVGPADFSHARELIDQRRASATAWLSRQGDVDVGLLRPHDHPMPTASSSPGSSPVHRSSARGVRPK